MRKVIAILATLLAALVVIAGSAGIAPNATAASGSSGTLNVLSYNVAGLPEPLSSAPTPRDTSTTTIGQRLGSYDLVNVQEDFNYHANLYAADGHRYRTPTSGGAGIGSGLNTLSGRPYDVDDFERVKWNSCQLDSGDCLTPKGFTFMRLRLDEGAYVDVYNAHTNAGTNSGDLSSRADNLDQLTSYIASHSAGNAVIVMGDTNTRYTRVGDTISAFVRDNGLTDAWVKLQRGGVEPTAGSAPLVCDPAAITDTCEVVDKILYRSSRLIALDATSFHNQHADFLDSSGAMLSDHDPVNVRFSWSTSPTLRFSDQFGGPHGAYYNDVNGYDVNGYDVNGYDVNGYDVNGYDVNETPGGGTPGGRVSSIFIRTDSRVDQVGANLSTGVTLAHGGSGGTYASLALADNEYVSSAYLCRAPHDGHTRIFYVKFTTNVGRTLTGGSPTSDCTTITAPAGWAVLGFHGRSGAEVDKLGLVFARR
jgi:endonuclease/exonuclease/phosphatase family metal-dependent hydrolase